MVRQGSPEREEEEKNAYNVDSGDTVPPIFPI
jgi:hypothetical protein